MYVWSLGTLSRLMSPSCRLGTSESDVRGDRVIISDSVNLMEWVRTPSFSESSKARTSPFICVTKSQHASCMSDTALERTNHWHERDRRVKRCEKTTISGDTNLILLNILMKNKFWVTVLTCRVTLYSWVSVRMAFLTTFTLSSLSNMFRFAISLRRSSLSLLLEKTQNSKNWESCSTFSSTNMQFYNHKAGKRLCLLTHHASSMKPMTNFLTSIDLSVWKAIISYKMKRPVAELWISVWFFQADTGQLHSAK